MLITKFKKSKWLKKDAVEALPASRRRTRIVNIEEDEVGDDTKLVCYFDGIEKGLPLNATNMDVLADASGSQDSDDFIGLAVEIVVDPNVRFQGKRVGGIVLKPIWESTPAPADEIAFDDAIPFGDNSPPLEAYEDEVA